MAVFSYDLFRQSSKEQSNQCVCVHSIYALLDLILEGAGGETRSEMLTALNTSRDGGADDASDENFNSVSGIFVDHATQVREHFASEIRRKNCLIETVSFRTDPDSALNHVNAFVKNRTKGKIDSILDVSHVTPSTDLILLNAVHFKAMWKEPFELHDTKPDYFLSLHGNILADFMYQECIFKYNEISDCKVLEIPYKNQEYAMLIFLPKYTKTLNALIQNLTPEFVSRNRANMTSQSVQVYLPKFKFSVSTELKPALMSLGIRQLFSDADLSGMSSSTVVVETVVQKIFIEVNETGTEAAAASAVVLATCALADLKDAKPVFKADRPFLFLVLRRDRPVFVGKLMEPDPSQKPKESVRASKTKSKRKRKCEIL